MINPFVHGGVHCTISANLVQVALDLGVLVLCNVLVCITRWTKSYQSAVVHTLPFVIVLCLFDLHMLGCRGDDVLGFVKHIPFVLQCAMGNVHCALC